jgi:peptidoglycan/xylan/chitin deacetylase (PgdA/CDA1 family)
VSARAYLANIEELDRLLATLAPVSPLVAKRRVFRYPFLEEGNTLGKRNAVRRYLKEHGYRIAEVTIDYNDWAWNDAYIRCSTRHDEASIGWLKAHVVDNAERHLRESRNVARLLFSRDIAHILLIHMGAFDAVTLDPILKDLRAQGVTFVTLDQALEDPVYRINPNLAFKGGETLLEQIAEVRKIDYEQFRENTYTIDKLSGICPETRAKSGR